MSSLGSIVSEALSSGLVPTGVSDYDMSYQISPIILVGGIAANAAGGQMPIISLFGQSTAFNGTASILGGLDNFLARYLVIPGGQLISNAIGTYPFANQQVAANAIIQNPLNVSVMMIAPVRDAGGMTAKLPNFTSLQNSLQAHNNAGGTYNVATPAFIYTNCLLTSIQDVTSGETKQKQIMFQWDFVQPLISQQAATSAYNTFMGKVASGQQLNPNQLPTVGPAGGVSQGAAPSNSSGSVITYPNSP